MAYTVVVVFLSFLAVLGSGKSCNIAPQFWCDSEAIAIECGVLSNCASRLFPARTADPVTVSVYFESLCPDSIRFLTTQLYPTWEKLQNTGVMHVEIFPFGKSIWHEQPDGSLRFVCQHGANECTGNKIENCIISATNNDEAKYLPVVNCMELENQPWLAAEECVRNAGLDWEPINACSNGVEGDQLLLKTGEATKALNPRLNWVPWIVMNGVHTDAIQNAATANLLKTVCDTYQGEKPSECSNARKLRFVPGDQ